jgi:hypothetical protein
MDIQSTIQDAFISPATFRKDNSQNPLYLYQLGTDELENLFSSIRTITHSQTCDYLELSERIKMAYDIEDVYTRRPELRPSNRLTAKSKQKSTLDHSSVLSWSSDLSTVNLDLETIWSLGAEKAVFLLKSYNYKDDEFIVEEELTMMNSIGYNFEDDGDENEEDQSNEEYSNNNNNMQSTNNNVNDAESDEDEIENLVSQVVNNEEDLTTDDFMEMVNHPNMSSTLSSKIMLDGVETHKSRAVNLVINLAPFRQDRDRINRVKTGNNVIKVDETDDDNDADIRIADLMVTITKFKDSSLAVVVFSIDKIIESGLSKSSIDIKELKQVVLSGSILNLNFKDNNSYVYHDGTYGENISVYGKFCVKIKARIEEVDGEFRVVFDLSNIKEHIDYCKTLINENKDMTLKLKKITSPFNNKETFEFF